MTDSTNPVQNSQRPLTGREYVEQLRQRRLEKHQPTPTTPTATIEPVTSVYAAPQPIPVQPAVTTPLSEPTPVAPVIPAPAAPQPVAESEYQHSGSSLADMLPDMPKPIPEETVLTWRAPSRPFKKRDRQYYTTIAIIVFLISLILFFAGQFLPIAVVVSVGFLSYVLSSVPPDHIEHKITTYGFRIENNIYYWEELGRFWFEEKFGQPLLHIEIARFPNRLTMVLGELSKEELRELLSEVLLEEKPKPTMYDKIAQWLQEKIPLEITNK